MTPAAALAAKVDAMWAPGQHLAFATDSLSYADQVLLAIRRPTVSCVISIAKTEYDGLAIAQLFGFEQAKPDPMKAAIEAKRNLKCSGL